MLTYRLKKHKYSSLIITVLFLVSTWTSITQAESVLRDMQGQITTIEAQQIPGKWTIVMIWASDCHVCNQEANQYSDFHTKHADKDAQILGLSIDGMVGKKDALAFIKRNGVIFPNTIGDIETVARWYQNITGTAFRATPTFVVFDPDGKLTGAQPGAVPPDIIEKFMVSNS